MKVRLCWKVVCDVHICNEKGLGTTGFILVNQLVGGRRLLKVERVTGGCVWKHAWGCVHVGNSTSWKLGSFKTLVVLSETWS